MSAALLALLVALTAAGADATDDPMIRWDCDRDGDRLVLEMVRPPVAHVTDREHLLLSGTPGFEQCRLKSASWTLLVDIVEYHSGRCEPLPDTTVSLMRNDRLVLSRVPIGHNCARGPVLSAVRVDEAAGGMRIELCAAPAFGAEARCAPLDPSALREAIDDAGIADRARR